VTASFVLPAVAALLTAAAIGIAPRRAAPATATRLLTFAIVAASAATLAALTAIGMAYLMHIPRLAHAIGWCQAVASHHHDRVPPEAGVPAIVLLTLMIGAAARTVWRRRQATGRAPSGDGVEIVASAQPLAYAVPGRPGHVVVSVGMIRSLSADERRVLFAHEHAHLRLGHHRFLAAGEVAAAALPVLRPLLRQLRFATERWADEAAAHEIGDRALVARAIARAALAGQPAGVQPLTFTGSGVAARVDALLDGCDPASGVSRGFLVLITGVAAATAVGSGIQLHHLATFISELCH
jgi:Zn-dependent protease with chaperone function